MAYCVKCGTQLSEGDNFCPNCGTVQSGSTPIDTNKKEITIGRSSSCDISLGESAEYASTSHGTIFWNGNQLMYKDTSTNGTVINNMMVHLKTVPINHGDTILIAGKYQISWEKIDSLLAPSSLSYQPTRLLKLNTVTSCRKCGTQLKDGAKFCQNCGRSLKENTTITSQNEENDFYEGVVETKKGFKKFLPFIFGVIIILVIIGYLNTKDSKGGKDSAPVTSFATVDSTTITSLEREMIITIDDIIEYLNLMKGCSGLTNQAKSNYQKARPSIEAIAKRNGFTIYEYHHINGDLGQGEMSSYCCYLYKNCKINKDETGYPTFSPTNDGVCCVLSEGAITVYDKDSYDELVRQIKEKCKDKLYSETFVDGEAHYYSDGKYCYYMGFIGSGEYRIPIDYADNSDGSSFNQYSQYVGRWILRKTTDEGRKMIMEVTLKEDHSGDLAVLVERGNVADVIAFEEYPQCILEDGIIYMTKNGDINGRGVPKIRVGSDGLYSYDGGKYIRQSE